MSHYLIAKEMLANQQIGPFICELLNRVFKDGYSFQDPQYPKNNPAVEIYIQRMTKEKSVLLNAAMRLMCIQLSSPCGVTRLVTGNFNAEIRELKKILISASKVEPDSDTNVSVIDH